MVQSWKLIRGLTGPFYYSPFLSYNVALCHLKTNCILINIVLGEGGKQFEDWRQLGEVKRKKF